jgi:drug/metabolite transporter (DMT)-like permease
MAPRPALISTAEGTTFGAFGGREWGLVAFCSVVWGASFLFIAEALEAFPPISVAFLRVLFGFATLSLFRSSRLKIDRADLPRIVLLGVLMMALPFTLYAFAEEHLASSVAGMINGGFSLTSAVIASVLLRRLPGKVQRRGLLVGFLGIVLVSLPSLGQEGSAKWGILLALLAIWSYGAAQSLVVPLQQKYGSHAVLWGGLLVALILTAPLGVAGLFESSFSMRALLASLALGVGGTGLAFIAATKLAGRVGAARGSIYGYLTTPVAILLGVAIRGEDVAGLSLLGAAIIIVSAWLVSRPEVR